MRCVCIPFVSNLCFDLCFDPYDEEFWSVLRVCFDPMFQSYVNTPGAEISYPLKNKFPYEEPRGHLARSNA